jgi:hypothetical protein
MSRQRRKGAERNAGVFLGPGILIPAPMRTLSDDIVDEPTYPEDEHEPEPDQPGLVRRVVERLARRRDPRH